MREEHDQFAWQPLTNIQYLIISQCCYPHGLTLFPIKHVHRSWEVSSKTNKCLILKGTLGQCPGYRLWVTSCSLESQDPGDTVDRHVLHPLRRRRWSIEANPLSESLTHTLWHWHPDNLKNTTGTYQTLGIVYTHLFYHYTVYMLLHIVLYIYDYFSIYYFWIKTKEKQNFYLSIFVTFTFHCILVCMWEINSWFLNPEVKGIGGRRGQHNSQTCAARHKLYIINSIASDKCRKGGANDWLLKWLKLNPEECAKVCRSRLGHTINWQRIHCRTDWPHETWQM